MNQAIEYMLSKYKLNSLQDYENALKEIIQQIALLGLWRAKFFEHAAFYGGTALRILYQLDRFSEDIDFSLLKPNKEFKIINYRDALINELESFGFRISIEEKVKHIDTQINSAFIKADTYKNIINIKPVLPITSKIGFNKMLKIKLEIDTNPPQDFNTEVKYIFQPIPFSVNTFSLPSLFAGKMHALLCRKWKIRVKGRDWYDAVWFVSKGIPVNLKHLAQRMKQTGHLKETDELNRNLLLDLFKSSIDNIDLQQAKNDIMPYLKNPDSINIWSKNFYYEIMNNLKTIDIE